MCEQAIKKDSCRVFEMFLSRIPTLGEVGINMLICDY